MIENPKFSVIIPTFNRPNFLGEAIQSILNQSYDNLEIIIVDDASSTEHKSVIREACEKDDRIILVENPVNLGVSQSRNEGIKRAKGDYIIFLDDDDCLGVDVFQATSKIFEEQKESDIVIYSSTVHQSSNKNLFHYHVVKETLKLQPFRRTYNQGNLTLLIKYPPQINSMVFRSQLFEENKFDPNLGFGEDIYLWGRLLKKKVKFSKKISYSESVSAMIRIHGYGHLSQPTHHNVVSFLMKMKSEFQPLESETTALLDLKLLMRYILLKDFKNSIRFFFNCFKRPISFSLVLLSQMRVKSLIFLSFFIYKVLRYDI